MKLVRRKNNYRKIKKARLFSFILILVLTAFIVMNTVSFFKKWNARVDYDVVVIGGEPEGVAAAVSAARNGLDVLLVDEYDQPGGRIIQSKVGDVKPDVGPNGDLLNQGLFWELYQAFDGDDFNLTTIQNALEKMLLAEDSLERLPERYVVDARVRRDRVVYITLNDGQRIRASRFIDATPGANAALQAGAVFFKGAEEIHYSGLIPVSLVIEIGGLDWDLVFSEMHYDEAEEAAGFVLGEKELLFSDAMGKYQPLDPMIYVPGLKMVKQGNGTALVEAMYINEVDSLCLESREEAWLRGEREAEFLIRYMRQNLPGFQEAFLAVLAPRVTVQETRHLKSLYRLSLEDILEHRDFWDKISLSSSPVYNQTVFPTDKGRILGNPVLYSVPFRSLVPDGLTNLLVVGPSAGYTFFAQGSAGKIPLGINTAQAAGIAAVISLENEVNFHRLSQDEDLVAHLQKRLVDQGAYLRSFNIPHVLEGHAFYPAVRELRTWGLVFGGYENEYHLRAPVQVVEIHQLLQGCLERCFNGRYHVSKFRDDDVQATVDDLIHALEHISDVDPYEMNLDEIMVRYNFYPGRPLNRGEVYAFMVDFSEILNEHEMRR